MKLPKVAQFPNRNQIYGAFISDVSRTWNKQCLHVTWLTPKYKRSLAMTFIFSLNFSKTHQVGTVNNVMESIIRFNLFIWYTRSYNNAHNHLMKTSITIQSHSFSTFFSLLFSFPLSSLFHLIKCPSCDLISQPMYLARKT